MARSSANPQPTSITKRPLLKMQWPLGWFWPVFWSALMVGSGFLGFWALVWLTRIPPLPNCDNTTPASSANNRLICAQEKLQSGSAKDLGQAVQLTAKWSESHLLYKEAYPVLVEASQRLLKKATTKMHRGDLTRATEWASQIPLDTPLRQPAQAAIWEWQQEWKQGRTIQNTVQRAIAARDWTAAEEGLQALKLLSSDYWVTNRHGELQRAQQQEQQAWAQIDQARALASTGTPENIGQALTLAQQVDLTSQAWAEAQAEIDRWSQNILLYSFQRWELGDIDGAIAAVQKVPPDPTLAPEARDLIQFSHAKRLADQAMQPNLDYMQLFQLMEAIRAVQDIGPDSILYKAAQQSLQDWQTHLEDLQTLQFAHIVASWRQPWTYEYATQLAWTVELERPRRLQAQTLIAHWDDEIERIEDRPYLQRAQDLAQRSTIPALQAAITEARKILLGRALRIEAQTGIAAWTNQIEVIQDLPVLNQANTLASDGNLQAAIETAQQIDSERALYDQAQAMIQDWTRTIQIQEDTPLLEEAKALAYNGSLTRAINVASQIAPWRALYDEAQTAIALWDAERRDIWAIQAAAAEAEAAAETGSESETEAETAAPASDSEVQPSDSSQTPSQPPPPTSNNP